MPRPLTAQRRALLAQGLSFALHLGLLAAAFVARPALGATDEATVPADSAQYTMYPVTAAQAEPEPEERLLPLDTGAYPAEYGGGLTRIDDLGGRAGLAEGQAQTGELWVIGPQDNPDPRLPRRGSEDGSQWSTVGPFEPAWGERNGYDWHEGMGQDPKGTHGNLQAAAPADVAGHGGASPAGVGRGGNAPVCRGPLAGGGTIGMSPLRRAPAVPAPGKGSKGSSAPVNVPMWRRPSGDPSYPFTECAANGGR